LISFCVPFDFIKSGPENPVLWTGMKGVSAKSRKNLNQMLKRVQHDNRVRVSFFCHPELVSGSRCLVLRIWVLKPRPVGGVLYFSRNPKVYVPKEKSGIRARSPHRNWGQAYFLGMAFALWWRPLMVRPLRIEFPGAVYHLTSRGNEKIEEEEHEERYGYTQREVADHLGMHFSSISKIIRERKEMLRK
jgi:hypothetical protein